MAANRGFCIRRWSDILLYSVLSFFIVLSFGFVDVGDDFVEKFFRGKPEILNLGVSYMCGLMVRGILISFDVARFESIGRDVRFNYPSIIFSVSIVILFYCGAYGYCYDKFFWFFLIVFFLGLFYVGLNHIWAASQYLFSVFKHPSYRANYFYSKVRPFNYPITSWSMDEYSFESKVSSLVSAFAEGDVKCIGIYGEYGVGKSSAINLLEHDLKAHGKYIFVRVSAWGDGLTHQDSRSFVIHKVIEYLSKWLDVCYMKHSHSDFSKGISASFGISFNLSNLFFPRKSPEDWLKDIDDVLSVNNMRVVVVFEDIDRAKDPSSILDDLASFVDFLSETQNVFFIFSLKPSDSFYDKISKVCQKSYSIEGYDVIPEFNLFMDSLYAELKGKEIRVFENDIIFSHRRLKYLYPNIVEPFRIEKSYLHLFRKIIKTPRDWRLLRKRLQDDFKYFAGKIGIDEMVVLSTLCHFDSRINNFFRDNLDSIKKFKKLPPNEHNDNIKLAWDGVFSDARDKHDDLYELFSFCFVSNSTFNYNSKPRIQSVLEDSIYIGDYYFDVFFNRICNFSLYEKDIIDLILYADLPDKEEYFLLCFKRSGFFPDFFNMDSVYSFTLGAIGGVVKPTNDSAVLLLIECSVRYLEEVAGEKPLSDLSRRKQIISKVFEFFDEIRMQDAFPESLVLRLANIISLSQVALIDVISPTSNFVKTLVCSESFRDYYVKLYSSDLNDFLSLQVRFIYCCFFKHELGSQLQWHNDFYNDQLVSLHNDLNGFDNNLRVLILHSLFLSLNGNNKDVDKGYFNILQELKSELDFISIDRQNYDPVEILKREALSYAGELIDKIRT